MSAKVHTTQTYSQAITNRSNSQIIIFDTPGIVSDQEIKKHNCGNFVSSCRHSIQNSNIIAVLHDISNRWTRNELHPLILELLKEYQSKPSFLILNKIDKVRGKKVLLDTIKSVTCNNISLNPNYKMSKTPTVQENSKVETGWPNFKEVFLVSSIKGDGIDKVIEYVNTQCIEGPWQYRNNETTDQKPETLIQDFVRARLLDYLPQEIPYNLKVELEYFNNDNNKMCASVLVVCPNERHEKLLCGAFDGKLKQITDRVTSDMIESFRVPVTLTISTQVKNKES